MAYAARMLWASAVAQEPALERAAAEAVARIQAGLDGAAPDLVAVFASQHHAASAAALAELLAGAFPRATLIGCSARSVLGAGRELEDGPGLALAAGVLPGARAHAFHLAPGAAPAPDASAADWHAALGVAPADAHGFVLIADPWSTDGEGLIRGLDAAYPAAVKVGGLASGGDAPGAGVLLGAQGALRGGVVGVALGGDVELDALVAQGCKPIGNPMFVTRCRDEWLQELDGRPPAELLQQLYESADPRDRELFRGSLFLGLEMTPARHEYGPGDFLIRNLVGGDPETGALAVAAPLREAQVVQFHLRDGRAAARDLEDRLARAPGDAPRGALLFSCLGRGRHLYGVPDHDSAAFARRHGPVALAGFFCNGEIGPVGGQTFLHGYTSAFGLFRPRAPRA
jgi:small ligand-binding sensory domain FIST